MAEILKEIKLSGNRQNRRNILTRKIIGYDYSKCPPEIIFRGHLLYKPDVQENSFRIISGSVVNTLQENSDLFQESFWVFHMWKMFGMGNRNGFHRRINAAIAVYNSSSVIFSFAFNNKNTVVNGL